MKLAQWGKPTTGNVTSDIRKSTNALIFFLYSYLMNLVLRLVGNINANILNKCPKIASSKQGQRPGNTFLSRDHFCRLGLSTCDALGLGRKWLALPTQLQRFCRFRRCSRDRRCLCVNRLFIHRTPAWTIH